MDPAMGYQFGIGKGFPSIVVASGKSIILELTFAMDFPTICPHNAEGIFAVVYD
jgi:hypothetical protein